MHSGLLFLLQVKNVGLTNSRNSQFFANTTDQTGWIKTRCVHWSAHNLPSWKTNGAGFPVEVKL